MVMAVTTEATLKSCANKANHTDAKTAASLWFCHRCLQRYN